MPHDYKDDWQVVVEEARQLNSEAGDVMKAFGGISKAVMPDGALERKVKELIALGIGIAEHCEGCIISHVRGALKNGATQEEVNEAVGVAVMMGGGPATVYGARAIEIAKQFSEK